MVDRGRRWYDTGQKERVAKGFTVEQTEERAGKVGVVWRMQVRCSVGWSRSTRNSESRMEVDQGMVGCAGKVVYELGSHHRLSWARLRLRVRSCKGREYVVADELNKASGLDPPLEVQLLQAPWRWMTCQQLSTRKSALCIHNILGDQVPCPSIYTILTNPPGLQLLSVASACPPAAVVLPRLEHFKR